MPIIGYNTIGGTTDTAQSNWQPEAYTGSGERYTGVTGDTVTQVAVYGGTGGAAVNVVVGIYTFSGGVPVTRVGTGTVSIGSATQWWTTTVSFALTNGVDYCVALDPYEDGTWTYYFASAVGNYSLHNVGNPVSLPATWAEGSTGVGTSSVYATVTSGGGSAPDAPTAVTARPFDGEASIEWVVPADNGSAITDYVVQYAVDSGTPSWSTFSDGTSTNRWAKVTGLTNGVAYIFRVAATNANGTSSYSTQSTAVSPRVLTEYPPYLEYRGGLTQNARIPNSKNLSELAFVSSVAETFAITLTTETTAADTVPDAVSDLAGTPGNAQVVLTWTAPADGGDAITDYVVDYRVSGTAPSGLRYPTSISGRKVLDQDGYPYLMKTMAAWSMGQNLFNADITTELEKIAARGFNAVTVHVGGGYDLTGSWAHVYTNSSSAAFWTGTPWASSLGSGWSTFDHIADETARLDLVLNLSLPAAFGSTGAAPDWGAVTNTNMYNAGVAIATRYLAYNNIVWHIMLDDTYALGSTTGQRLEAFFDGVNDTEGPTMRPIRWMEVANGSSTNDQGWMNSTQFNANINCEYQYVNNSTEMMEGIYGELSVPVGDCEPPYVGAPHYSGTEAQQLRERTWATFLEGGVLAQFGHEDYWPFGQTGIYTAGLTFDQVMTHQRLIDQSYAFTVIDLYCRDTTWAPTSSFVTTGAGSGDTKAAIGASDTAALAYFPNSRTIAVDTTIITGTANVRLRWYDPSNGSYTSISASEAQSAGRSVTHPGNNSQGHGDWVLVVDLADGTSGSSPGSWSTFSDGTSSSTGATVTGLTNGTAYDFRVAAVNTIGQGAWSNIAGPYTPSDTTGWHLIMPKYWNGTVWAPRAACTFDGSPLWECGVQIYF